MSASLSSVARRPRSVDPYRDVDVIDAHAPRTNQAIIGSLALVALITSFTPLVAALAAQLIIGLTLGRRYCLACVLYFEVLQPRLGEGPLEDSAAPRFANQIGAGVLTAATVFLVAGLPAVGWVLTAMVACLALLAATTGLCVGCAIYQRVWGCATCAATPPA